MLKKCGCIAFYMERPDIVLSGDKPYIKPKICNLKEERTCADQVLGMKKQSLCHFPINHSINLLHNVGHEICMIIRKNLLEIENLHHPIS